MKNKTIKIGYVLEYKSRARKITAYMCQDKVNKSWYISDYIIDAEVFEYKAQANNVAFLLRQSLKGDNQINVIEYNIEQV